MMEKSKIVSDVGKMIKEEFEYIPEEKVARSLW
jgi:hypothetical protein